MKQETFKKIVKLADGFEWKDKENEDYEIQLPENNTFLCSWCNHFRTDRWKQIYYPFLIRRAVAGWNEGRNPYPIEIMADSVEYFGFGDFRIINRYQDYKKSDYLNPQEQAIEACLIELLEAE